MSMKLIAGAVLASLAALAGCNRDTEEPFAGGNVGPDVVTTPNETASQAAEPMPETLSSGQARIEGGPMPAAPAVGLTLVESTIPGPGGSAYLADTEGRAVYVLDGDRDGSACTGACLQSWPPVLVTDVQPAAGPNLDASMLASIKRADGSMQVTYNGRPLYRYAADSGRVTTGHMVKDGAGQWTLITARGEPVTARPDAATGQAGGMR